MTDQEIISEMRGQTKNGKSTAIALYRDRQGKLVIEARDGSKRPKATHIFSESAFKQFFGGILEETADPIRLVPSDRKKRIELVMDLLEELDEEDIEFINQRIRGDVKLERQSDRKIVKLEVLQHMDKIDPIDQDSGFLSREFIGNSPYSGTQARTWINYLAHQGYLRKLEADHEDGRIDYEYALTEKAENYLDYMEEQGALSN